MILGMHTCGCTHTCTGDTYLLKQTLEHNSIGVKCDHTSNSSIPTESFLNRNTELHSSWQFLFHNLYVCYSSCFLVMCRYMYCTYTVYVYLLTWIPARNCEVLQLGTVTPIWLISQWNRENIWWTYQEESSKVTGMTYTHTQNNCSVY